MVQGSAGSWGCDSCSFLYRLSATQSLCYYLGTLQSGKTSANLGDMQAFL